MTEGFQDYSCDCTNTGFMGRFCDIREFYNMYINVPITTHTSSLNTEHEHRNSIRHSGGNPIIMEVI